MGLLVCTPYILYELAPLYEHFNFIFLSSALLRGMPSVIVVLRILQVIHSVHWGLYTWRDIEDSAVF